MRYAVWCRGAMLGHSDLAEGGPAPNVRVGHLDTTAEFDHLWPEIAPVVDEVLAAAVAMGSVMADVPPAPEGADPLEYGREVHERIKDHPGSVRVRAANEAITALAFELRDEAGNRVAADFVMVQEVKLPDDIPREAFMRHLEEARRDGHDVRFPHYLVTARVSS